MRIFLFLFILFAMGLILAPSVQAQRTLFVNQQATGANNGTSFTDAYTSLQDALQDARPGDEIRVAAGTYCPDEGQSQVPGDRVASFFLKNGVRILGGFDPATGLRDWQQHETILSGDLMGNDTDNIDIDEPSRSDNTLHLVVAPPGTDTTAILDGFIIRSAHADIDSTLAANGAGMLIMEDTTSQVKLSNLIFENNVADNLGGGLANRGGALWISNVSFLNNLSDRRGGGMYHSPRHLGAIAYIDNAFWKTNKAFSGGALHVVGGGVVVTNSIFLQNEAGAGGAVMHQYNNPFFGGAEALYANVSFLGNIGTDFGGALCSEDNSVITIFNGVFSGNQSNGSGNSNYGWGGAIVNLESAQLTLLHSVMANNTAHDGGAINNGSGDVFIYNSIIQNNAGVLPDTENLSMELERGSITLDRNMIDTMPSAHVTDQGNNLIMQALFIDPLGPDGIAGTLDDDLRHAPGSPAIDAGDNALLLADVLDLDRDGNLSELLPLDRDGKERIANGSQAGLMVDLGPYEFNASFPVAIEPVQEAYNTACPDGPLAPAYPNPFSSETHLDLCIPQTGPVEVRIYDVLGREQSMVFHRVVEANQSYRLVIRREGLANGLYFVRMISGDMVSTRSIVLME